MVKPVPPALLRPTISARYLIALCAFSESSGIDIPTLAHSKGLPLTVGVDPEAEISFSDFIELIEAAAGKTRDAAFGIHYAEALPLRATGVFQNIVANSRTLRDAFQAMSRFIGLVTNAFEMQYFEKDGAGWLQLDMPVRSRAHTHFVDGQLAIVALRAKLLLGENCLPLKVDLQRAAPQALDEFRRMFGGNIQFGAELNRIGFSLATLDRHLPNSDPGLFRAVESYGAFLLTEKQQKTSLSGRTAQYISQSLQRGEATEKAACQALNMTSRTLQRGLAAEGTSFSEILESIRSSMARHYLTNTDLSLSAITFLLGYSELSAFSRAAKSWFGCAPSSLRKRRD